MKIQLTTTSRLKSERLTRCHSRFPDDTFTTSAVRRSTKPSGACERDFNDKRLKKDYFTSLDPRSHARNLAGLFDGAQSRVTTSGKT